MADPTIDHFGQLIEDLSDEQQETARQFAKENPERIEEFVIAMQEQYGTRVDRGTYETLSVSATTDTQSEKIEKFVNKFSDFTIEQLISKYKSPGKSGRPDKSWHVAILKAIETVFSDKTGENIEAVIKKQEVEAQKIIAYEKKIAIDLRKSSNEYIRAIRSAAQGKVRTTYKNGEFKSISKNMEMSCTITSEAEGKKYKGWEGTWTYGPNFWVNRFNISKLNIIREAISIYRGYTNSRNGTLIKSRHISHMIGLGDQGWKPIKQGVNPDTDISHYFTIELDSRHLSGNASLKMLKKMVDWGVSSLSEKKITSDDLEAYFAYNLQTSEKVAGVDWNVATATQEHGGYITPSKSQLLTIPNRYGKYAYQGYKKYMRAEQFKDARWITPGKIGVKTGKGKVFSEPTKSKGMPVLAQIKGMGQTSNKVEYYEPKIPIEAKGSKKGIPSLESRTSGPRIRPGWKRETSYITKGSGSKADKLDVLFFGSKGVRIKAKGFWAKTMEDLEVKIPQLVLEGISGRVVGSSGGLAI